MPDQRTIERAVEDAREGKSPSTQAGEFVREEIHHVREGKHGVSSPQQAIAIGLSKARRAGIKLGVPKQSSASVRAKAAQDEEASHHKSRQPSRKRSLATERALKREPRNTVTSRELSQQAKRSSARRGKTARTRAATKAARTRKAA
jgi:hypothetical protein